MKKEKSMGVLSVFLLLGALLIAGCGGAVSGGAGVSLTYVTSSADNTIRLTGDILGITSGGFAAAEQIRGGSTKITDPGYDSLAVDRSRNIIYLVETTGTMLAFEDGGVPYGDLTPDREISVNGAPYLQGLAVASGVSDRLYTASMNPDYLLIFNNASTRQGPESPDVSVDLPADPFSICLDETGDRLWVGMVSDDDESIIHQYTGASTMTGAASPDRTLELDAEIVDLHVDPVHDRLYLCCSTASQSGYDFFVFSGAAGRQGNYDLDTDSAARTNIGAVSAVVDGYDNLYLLSAVGPEVWIYRNASTLSGALGQPDSVVFGVASGGGGLGSDYLVP